MGRAHYSWRGQLLSSLVALAGYASGGCDLEKGPREVGDVLNPRELTYLQGPGERIVAGDFRELRPAVTWDVGAVLLARTGNSLAVIDVATRTYCKIPNVEQYQSGSLLKSPPVLPYLTATDENGRGTLRFAALDCTSHGLEVAGVRFPMVDYWTSQGFVVRVGSSLVLVDPAQGVTSVLVNELVDATYVLDSAEPQGATTKWTWLVHGDGQLWLFDSAWRPLTRFGDRVDSVVLPKGVTSSLYNVSFTDAAGLNVLHVDAGDPQGATVELLAAGACAVARGARTDYEDLRHAVIYRSPCSEPRLLLSYGSYAAEYVFDVDVAPELTRVLYHGAFDAPVLAYIREDQPGTGVGSLFLATPGADVAKNPELFAEGYAPLPLATSFPIAEHVDFQWLQQVGSDYYVLDQIEGETGRLVRFGVKEPITSDPDPVPLWGPEVVAERVRRRLDTSFVRDENVYPALEYELIVANWDGTVGDLGTACSAHVCGSFETRIARVPKNGFFAARGDLDASSTALYGYRSLLLSDFDGTTGTLRLAKYWPTNPQEFPAIAQGVLPAKFGLLEQIGLPGAAFVRALNGNANAGRLEYYNFDLQANGIVHDHVSELVAIPWPVQGVMYVVPDGPDGGVWFARGK